MKKKILTLLIFSIIFLFSPLQLICEKKEVYPTAKEILKKVDANLYSNSKKMKCKMVVTNRRGRKRVLVMESYTIGDKKSFSHYLSPKKDRGTKMLKVDKNIWTYTPKTDRVIHIAGHLLRQSIMGSDLSYEDSMEEVELADLYDSVVIGKEEIDGNDAWILELKNCFKSTAYPKRKIWVDCKRYLPLKEERFAKSGKLLKTTKIQAYKKIDNRWYPTNILYKDVLKSGKGTEFIIDEIIFNPEIPKGIFTKQSLRK